MHIVTATASCQPGKRDAMVDVLTTLTQASRGDEGCINYEFWCSIEDQDSFTSVEMWESAEAAGSHLQQPHVATALEDLAPLLAGPPEIIQHAVSETTKLA